MYCCRIFSSRLPKRYQSGGREVRVDYYATRLPLLHDGDEVRKSGEGIFVDCERELRVPPEAPAVSSFATHDT